MILEEWLRYTLLHYRYHLTVSFLVTFFFSVISFTFSFPANISMLLSLSSQNVVCFTSLPIPATWFLFLYYIFISYERYQTEFYNFLLVFTGNHFQGFMSLQEDVLLLLFCNMNSWYHGSLNESWNVRTRLKTCVCPEIMYLPTNNV